MGRRQKAARTYNSGLTGYGAFAPSRKWPWAMGVADSNILIPFLMHGHFGNPQDVIRQQQKDVRTRKSPPSKRLGNLLTILTYPGKGFAEDENEYISEAYSNRGPKPESNQ